MHTPASCLLMSMDRSYSTSDNFLRYMLSPDYGDNFLRYLLNDDAKTSFTTAPQRITEKVKEPERPPPREVIREEQRPVMEYNMQPSTSSAPSAPTTVSTVTPPTPSIPTVPSTSLQTWEKNIPYVDLAIKSTPWEGTFMQSKYGKNAVLVYPLKSDPTLSYSYCLKSHNKRYSVYFCVKCPRGRNRAKVINGRFFSVDPEHDGHSCLPIPRAKQMASRIVYTELANCRDNSQIEDTTPQNEWMRTLNTIQQNDDLDEGLREEVAREFSKGGPNSRRKSYSRAINKRRREQSRDHSESADRDDTVSDGANSASQQGVFDEDFLQIEEPWNKLPKVEGEYPSSTLTDGLIKNEEDSFQHSF